MKKVNLAAFELTWLKNVLANQIAQYKAESNFPGISKSHSASLSDMIFMSESVLNQLNNAE